MKKIFLFAFGAALAIGFAAPGLSQDSTVDPAELARIVAQHPDWAPWLAQPDLAKLVLAGPRLPNTPWRVHDIRRPQPIPVGTGEACAAPPPGDAEILFDGRDLDKWTGDHFGEWTLKDGVLTTGGHVYNFLRTREAFGDVQVHVEWKTPVTPNPPVNPQYRGNSGVFLMGLYELQILNSYKSETYPDGTAGGIYGQTPPLVNASRPPGMWQCFDIVFHPPHFSGDTVASPARITVLHNGVLVQDNTVLIGATVHGKLAHYAAHPAELPLTLQDHGNPDSHDSFRNVWIRRLSPE